MNNKEKKRVSKNIEGFGKLPPQAVELEEAVLGALMLEKESYNVVESFLKPEAFYKESNAMIFKAIETLHKSKKAVDILTVTEQLRHDGNIDVVGGAYHITQLTNRVASASNIEYHARIIVEKYLLRELITANSEYVNRAFTDEEDVFELIEENLSDLKRINDYVQDESDPPFAHSVKERIEEKKTMVKEGKVGIGLPTGNQSLDKYISGFVKGNLIYFGGRPSMGKTARMGQFCTEIAKRGNIVAVFTLEMSTGELIDRMICAESGIDFQDYRENKLTAYDLSRIENAGNIIRKLPIEIFDKGAINGNYIRRKVRSVIKKHGRIDFIAIDYVQLMRSNERINNREQEISEVSRDLKAIAKEFDCPIMPLVQLSRAVENAWAKKPTMVHLRESGQLEQDADVVMFIYRPSYYYNLVGGETCPDDRYSPDNIDEATFNMATELIIAKNRNGKLGIVQEKFILSEQRFIGFNDYVEPQTPVSDDASYMKVSIPADPFTINDAPF